MKYFNFVIKAFAALLIISVLTGSPLYAQATDKVVLHISNPLKMTMLVNNIKNLRKMLEKDALIAVVVNGPAVARFSTSFSSRKQLDEILQQDADVSVCSFALKNKNISKEQLFEGVYYLEDGGVSRLVKLQQQGYAYIKP
ncbi:MAG: DsrE family protein [Gammaproteobacteria bacterium]|nr:DsrE family protein [Gammaproteobacteria bacterium]